MRSLYIDCSATFTGRARTFVVLACGASILLSACGRLPEQPADTTAAASSTISLSVANSELSMAPGETRQIDVAVQAPAAVTLLETDYDSADDAVAQVTQSGLVTAIAAGTSTITVRVTQLDSGATAEAMLVVQVAEAVTTWTHIANEYESFTVPAGSRVRYGADPHWVELVLSGTNVCGNATFGDPAYGATKVCEIAGTGTGADTTPPAGSVVTAFTSSDIEYPAADRGFYVTPEASEMTTDTLNGFAAEWGNRLFFYAIELAPYRSQALPSSFLADVDRELGALRTVGGKAVIMPTYSRDSSCDDASIDIVKQHLSQLKPILANNADVIAYVRAGIIGAWGEGDCSTNGLNEEPNRSALRDALFDAVPVQFHVAFQVTVLDAYRDFPRVAAKNDCFLASDTDAHNIPGGLDSPLRDFLKARTDITPYGGETCDNSEAGVTEARNHCTDILAEGSAYHVAHLSQGFSPYFLNTWKNEGCFEQVRRSIGYRLQLGQISHPATASGSATFQVTVRNVGWARTFSTRPLVVTLTDAGGNSFSGSAGSLNSVGAGTESTFAVTVSAPQGTYAVHVSAPDIYATTASDPRYAVRFANSDAGAQQWEASSGSFATGTEVTFQ